MDSNMLRIHPHWTITFLLVSLLFSSAAKADRNVEIVKVIDGDSVLIRLDGKSVECRLLSIDAPEWGQKPWGTRARRHLQELFRESGGRVIVEKDARQKDRHKRLLVYLWGRDGRMINRRMVSDGYALAYTIPPNTRYADAFRSDEKEAREARRGFWKDGGLKQRPSAYRRKHRQSRSGRP